MKFGGPQKEHPSFDPPLFEVSSTSKRTSLSLIPHRSQVPSLSSLTGPRSPYRYSLHSAHLNTSSHVTLLHNKP